ncbi:MAG: methionine synthase, partial [Halobacteriales archaeon]|nr:methionine synthase [Halobacteriales archaeon]
RPPELAELLSRHREGEPIDDERLARLVEEATRDVLDRQAETGIDVANNGEQAKTGFHFYIYDRLGGLGGETTAPMWADLEDYPELAWDRYQGGRPQPAVTEPVSYTGRTALEGEIETFFDLLGKGDFGFEETFLTAASPGEVATVVGNQHYDSHEAFVFALAEELREEYELIVESGAILQLDSPDLLGHAHRVFKDQTTAEFLDTVRLHIEALNEAVSGIPAERIRLHTCWGNYPGPHHRDIPLETVLPLLYEADVGALAIEQANPRHHHEYRAFETHPLPSDMLLIPGVVDVKTNIIEPPEVVADRLERWAYVVDDPTRIMAAPDCGFGTVAGGTMTVADEVVWAKLEALVAGAALASARLY